MNIAQAIRTIKQGKKVETPAADITAAMKVINEQRNRIRTRRLKRLGYSDTEVKNMLYTAP